LELEGKVYDAQMPGAPWANDQQVADLLTFIRRSWGNDGEPIEASSVTIERARIGGRMVPWSVEELEAIGD
ncbi:MAG: hypothetical protein KDA28_01680, partial [Phycisphaerales bacterium]|nr:hypothetical protein [Phycisphaerales bacterium]